MKEAELAFRKFQLVVGTRTLPFSIVGSEGEAINGVLDGHEIEGSAPLLLSQLAQISLGAVKDTRRVFMDAQTQ